MEAYAPQAPAYANLLPELLLALIGHPGDAFTERPAAEGESLAAMQLSQRVDWVTPPQRCAPSRCDPWTVFEQQWAIYHIPPAAGTSSTGCAAWEPTLRRWRRTWRRPVAPRPTAPPAPTGSRWPTACLVSRRH